jgi:four helix bundle protein
VWKESIELVQLVYEITQKFPSEEKFGLVSQLRRASVSVPSNIAEGYSRSSNKEYKRFVEIALVSILELETQLIIAAK